MLGELLKVEAGIDILHVPYKGSPPALIDLVSGQVQMMFVEQTVLMPHVQARSLKALAVTGRGRMAELPLVSTVEEDGFPKLQATAWSGIVAPSGTPATVVRRLNSAINNDLAAPETRANLAKLGAAPLIVSPEEFGALLKTERQRWSEVVKVSGIKAE